MLYVNLSHPKLKKKKNPTISNDLNLLKNVYFRVVLLTG